MYEAHDDPYCFPGTSVLRNKLDLRTQEELDAFDAFITQQRAEERLPPGEFTAEYYCAIHHHLFQDVYEWAGQIRTIRVAKGGNAFCYPEHIERELKRVFGDLADRNGLHGLAVSEFATLASHVLADINAIHPFREGNGRTQNSFLKILAERAGHRLAIARLDPASMLLAMIASFNGDEQLLAALISSLIQP